MADDIKPGDAFILDERFGCVLSINRQKGIALCVSWNEVTKPMEFDIRMVRLAVRALEEHFNGHKA